MKYIITESQYKNLIESDDRLTKMVNRYLDMTFGNMVRVDTKFGSGYKFDGDDQYQLNVFKNDSGKLQLAISSSLIKHLTSMFDVDKSEASELIAEYCDDVLGMEFDFLRVWPIKITESNLTQIMKRVIVENQSKVDALVDMIKSDGLRNVEKYFGDTENVKLFLNDKLTKSNVYDILTTRGYEAAVILAGGATNFAKILEINTPDDFLKLFDNLKSEVYEPNPQWTFLKDHNGTKIVGILTYPSGRKKVSINNRILGGVLSYVFGINNRRVEDILSEWIKDVYNIDDFYVTSSGGFSEG